MELKDLLKINSTVSLDAVDPEAFALVTGYDPVEWICSLVASATPLPQELGTPQQIRADILAALYQDDDAHDTCSLTACLNPLHPGPCKGWKGTLFKTAPGAWHSLEAAKVEKANAARLKKIADLKAANKPIPKKLLTPIVAKPHPHAGQTANKAGGDAHIAGQEVSANAGVKTSTPGKITLGQAVKQMPVQKGPKGKKPTIASKGIAFVIAQEKVTPQYKLDKAAAITPDQWNLLSEADQSTIRGELSKIKIDGFGPQQKKADELLAKLPIGGTKLKSGTPGTITTPKGNVHQVITLKDVKAANPPKAPAPKAADEPKIGDLTPGTPGTITTPKGKTYQKVTLKDAAGQPETPKTTEKAIADVLEKAKAAPPKVTVMTEPNDPTSTGQAKAMVALSDAIPGVKTLPKDKIADLAQALDKIKSKGDLKDAPQVKKAVTAFANAALKTAGEDKVPGVGHGDNDIHIGTLHKEITDHIVEGKPGLPPMVAKIVAHHEAIKPENVKKAIEKAATDAAIKKVIAHHEANPPKIQTLGNAPSAPPAISALTPTKIAKIIQEDGTADIMIGGKKVTVGFENDTDPGHGKLTMAPGGGYTVTTPDGEKIAYGKGELVPVVPKAAGADLPPPKPATPKAPAAETPKPLPKHVQHAIDMAKGTAPGASWSKNHLTAYTPLSGDEFDALPPDVQDKIVAELKKATTKFLDPKKTAATKALLAKFGHGDGSDVSAPKAATPPKIENVDFAKDLHNHAVSDVQAKRAVADVKPAALFLVAKEKAGVTDAENPDNGVHATESFKAADELVKKHTAMYTAPVTTKPSVVNAIANLKTAVSKEQYAVGVWKAKALAFGKVKKALESDNGTLSPIEKAALTKYNLHLLQHNTPPTDMEQLNKLKSDVKQAEINLDQALQDGLKQVNAPAVDSMSNAQVTDKVKELLGDYAVNPKTNLSLAQMKYAGEMGKAKANTEAAAYPPAVLTDPAVAAKLGALASVYTQINAANTEIGHLEDHLKQMHHDAISGTGVDKNGNPISAADKKIIAKHEQILKDAHSHLYTAQQNSIAKAPLVKAQFEAAAKSAEEKLTPGEPVQLSEFDTGTIDEVYRQAWGKAASKVVTYGIKTYGVKTAMSNHAQYPSLKADLTDLQQLAGKLAVATGNAHTAKLNVPTDDNGGMPNSPEKTAWLQAVIARDQLEQQFTKLHKTAQARLDAIRVDNGLTKRALPKLNSPAVKTAAAESAYYKTGGYGKPLYGKPASAKQYLVAKVGPDLAVAHKTSGDKAQEKAEKAAAESAKVKAAMPAPKVHVKPPSTAKGNPNAETAESLGYHFTPKVAEGDQHSWPTAGQAAYVASPEALKDLQDHLGKEDTKFGLAAQKEFKWSINNMESKGGPSGGKKALYAYTGSSYGSINTKLNSLPPGTKKTGSPQITSIDGAFAAAPPLEGDVILYRGFSSPEHVFKSGKWNDVNVAGVEWSQRSYSSTSGALSTAQSFAGYNGVVMRIIIPKEMGIKGINAKGGQHPGENEIILERGIRYRVVADYGKGPNDSRRYIDVMVVPNPYDKPE